MREAWDSGAAAGLAPGRGRGDTVQARGSWGLGRAARDKQARGFCPLWQAGCLLWAERLAAACLPPTRQPSTQCVSAPAGHLVK